MVGIIAIVFFTELANASEWIELYLFAAANKEHQSRSYITPGYPPNNTVERAFASMACGNSRGKNPRYSIFQGPSYCISRTWPWKN